MIALAHSKDRAEGVEAAWIKADMRHIQFSQPVDVALCMFDGHNLWMIRRLHGV